MDQEQNKNNENCHSENAGIDNRAFRSTSINAEETSRDKANKCREEIGLEGLSYRALCSCNETGKPCVCRNAKSPSNRSIIRLESWGRWKCHALSLLLTLIVCWIVIFTTLILTDVL